MNNWVIGILFIILIGLLFGIGYTGYQLTEKFKPALVDNLEQIGMIPNESATPVQTQIIYQYVTPTISEKDKQPQFEFVSETEYTQGDGNGSTIIKLIDWTGLKINTTCWETVLYPDKTMFFNWTTMIQHWEYGNYYLSFPLPVPLGIYDQEVRCYVGGQNISIGKAFHMGNISNIVSDKTNQLKQDQMSVVGE